MRCPHRLPQAASVRADGNAITLTSGGKNSTHSKRVWLSGPVTLAAHGETVTLHNPINDLRARRRAGHRRHAARRELCRARRRQRKRTGRQSANRCKALAIVVRTFALHEAHGHPDYDLCDSTHCQLLHWGGNPAAATRRSRRHAGHRRRDALVPWRARACLLQQRLRRTHRIADGDLAAGARSFLSAFAARSLLHGRRRQRVGIGADAQRSCPQRLRRPEWPRRAGSTSPSSAEASRAAPSRLRLDATQVSAETFRLAVGQSLGWNRIPSTWFEVSQQGDRFLFHGRGWGHGVGLCQKGAAAMAAAGPHRRSRFCSSTSPARRLPTKPRAAHGRPSQANGFILESLDAADAAYLPQLAHARAEASQRSGLNASRAIHRARLRLHACISRCNAGAGMGCRLH